METITLTEDDIIRVLRSMLVAELKRIRKYAVSEIDEFHLHPDELLLDAIGGLENHEATDLASAAFSFFDLDVPLPDGEIATSTLRQWADIVHLSLIHI